MQIPTSTLDLHNKIKNRALIRRVNGVKMGLPYIIPGDTNHLICEAREELEDAENYLTDAIFKANKYRVCKYMRLILSRLINRLAYRVLP